MTIALKDASRAKSFAHVVRDALRAELRTDMPLKTCLDAVARGLSSPDWKTASKRKDWPVTLCPDLAAGALSHDAGIPVRVVSAVIAGLEPAPVDHDLGKAVSTMLSGKAGAELGTLALAKRGGALVLAPAIRSIACMLADRPAVVAAGCDETDPRLVGIAVIVLAYWSRAMEVGTTFMPELERTDSLDLARRIRRAVDGADARALDEAVMQMSPDIEDQVMAMLGGIADEVMPRIAPTMPKRDERHVPYEPLPPESHASDEFMRNWGSRWRRLDAPDLVLVSQKSDTLLGASWLRIVTDLQDPDVLALGITPKDIMGDGGLLGNDEGDDAIWILGLGSDAMHVAPIAAMHFARYERQGMEDGEDDVYELFAREAGADAGRLRELAWATLAHIVVSQVADDVNMIVNETDDAVRVWPHIDRAPEDENLLSDAVAGRLVHLAMSINAQTGEDVIVLLDGEGRPVPIPTTLEDRPVRDGMPEFDHVAISSQLGPKPWGAVAVIHPSGAIGVSAVSPPGEVISADLRRVLDDLERTARQHAVGNEEDAVAGTRLMTAGYDALELVRGGPSAGSLELEMTRHNARVAVFTLPEDEGVDGMPVEGGSYATPKPGQSITQALIEAVERLFRDGPEMSVAVEEQQSWRRNDDDTYSIPLPGDVAEGLQAMVEAFEREHGVKMAPSDPIFAKGVDEHGNVMPLEMIPVPIDHEEKPVMGVMALVGMNPTNHPKARAIEEILMEELDLDGAPGGGPARLPDRRQFLMEVDAVSTHALAEAGRRIMSTGGVDFVDLTMMSMSPVTVTVENGSTPHAYHMG